MDDNNQIIIYQSEDGETRIEVKFTGETVWLKMRGATGWMRPSSVWD
ncbi:MAG: hypothetical protein HDS10_08190 [Bacteroides sp.]|nr:hypothetical protein [Bacteroides sp.]